MITEILTNSLIHDIDVPVFHNQDRASASHKDYGIHAIII